LERVTFFFRRDEFSTLEVRRVIVLPLQEFTNPLSITHAAGERGRRVIIDTHEKSDFCHILVIPGTSFIPLGISTHAPKVSASRPVALGLSPKERASLPVFDLRISEANAGRPVDFASFQ